MTDLIRKVALTNVNMETLSRKDMLDWINTAVNGKYEKIEELCSGVAYCEIMEQLFPNCVGLKKIKKSAKLQHEQLHNLRLLQNALTRLKCEKSVPIERLLKGRFQDNFEFLQWFKKFYDTFCNSTGKENIPNNMIKSKMGTRTQSYPLLNVKSHKLPQNLAAKETQARRSVSPSTINTLQHDVEVLKEKIEDIKADKDYYFKKLTAVEALLKRSMERHEHENFCKRAFNIIYAVQSDNESDSKPE